MHIVIILVLIYLAFHVGHSHSLWRQNRKRGFLRRCWISVPGPFHTRIGRRL
jgi:hypothetical protein